MALEVGIVGLPSSGKSMLFEALTGAKAQNEVGMAAIPDPRLQQLADVVHARKVTPAAIRVSEVRGTGPALLGNLRQVDALLVVVDGFSPGADPARERLAGLLPIMIGFVLGTAAGAVYRPLVDIVPQAAPVHGHNRRAVRHRR